MSMQPIWNLDDLASWSSNEAKPTVRVTVTDPDSNNLNAIEYKVYTVTGEDPDVDTPAYTTTKYGTWSSGSVVDHDLGYGLTNDTDYYMYARARDTFNEWGAWSTQQSIKVRWSQAIYEHNTGATASQMAFTAGTLAGSSPSAAYIFRSATDAASGSPSYGAWKSSIDQAEGAAYVNVLVRLAIGRDTATATSVADLNIDYIGAALQPDSWAFTGDDTTAWTLSESQRRYGTKSLRWIRESSTMSPTYAEAHTDHEGTEAVVPVVEDTQYTISIWVKGTDLSSGKVYGYARLPGETDKLAMTEEITGVNTDWTRLTTTFDTPAGTSAVEIGVTYESTATGAGDIFYVDALQLEEGTVATAWNPGATGAVVIDVGGIAVDGDKGATFRLKASGGDIIELDNDGLTQEGRLLSPMPAGSMTAYAAANSAPTGWLICDGAAVSRTTYADLWDAIGTTYGVGDGSTTFNVPNMKGRVLVGMDTGDTDFNSLGETGGWKTHDHGTHTHGQHRHGHDGATAINYAYTNVRADIAQATISSAVHDHGLPWSSYVTPTASGNASASQVQPYRAMPYIIKT